MAIYRKRVLIFGSLIIFLATTFLSGCASLVQQKNLGAFNELYASGKYQDAAALETKRKGTKKDDPSKLLQDLQAATALRCAKQYEQSSALFDECEEIIKHHNEKLLAANAASNIGAVLVNDAVLDYRGTIYDGIMVNTYKALNFWQKGKTDLARVEFNRALDRQRRAKGIFAAQIAKMKKEIDKKQREEKNKTKANKGQALDINTNANNPEIDKILKEKYSNLYAFKSYPDFINPFTTYIAGLFFMSDGDYAKADTLLKEAYGMSEKNTAVADDFAQTEKILDGRKNKKKYVWVIFENGLGPEKEEFRVDLPLILVSKKVKYTGIALPKLKFRDPAYPYLIIAENNKKVCKTSMVCNMDRVVQTEFKKEYKSIVTRAVISALVKTAAQYEAQKKFGDMGGFVAAIYQGATTSADIRTWTSLPKEFQVAKVPAPSNGVLSIETPVGESINVTVPEKSNALIYVKIPTPGAAVTYNVIKM